MRGSKDQSFLSRWDILRNVYNEFNTSSTIGSEGASASTSDDSRSRDREQSSSSTNMLSKYSNVGLTLASEGIKTYVANYRLVEGDEPAHPHQVMDVARAIAFVLEREQQKQQKCESNDNDPRTRIVIMGYSAGSHLTSLALTDSKYLNVALKERGMQLSDATQMIRGYISLSGVFNLKRLSHSFLKDITIVPAFLGQKHRKRSDDNDNGDNGNNDNDDANEELVHQNDESILLASSPLHLLLSANKRIRSMHLHNNMHNSIHNNMPKKQEMKTMPITEIPLIAQIPILLLNAESDFHLQSDAKEMMVALQQFDPFRVHEHEHVQEHILTRLQKIIPAKHHLSIMWDFGSGFLTNSNEEWTEEAPVHVDGCNKHNGTVVELLRRRNKNHDRKASDDTGIRSWFSSTAEGVVASMSFYIVGPSEKDVTASTVLTFVRKELSSR